MKKQIILLIIIVSVVLLLSRLVKNKHNGMFTEQDAKDAILFLAKYKDVERAKLFERLLRLETAHFTTQQYKNTGSAGMEDGAWYNLPPHEVKTFHDPIKGNRPFIVWHSVTDFAKYWSDYVDRHFGDWAQWNSKDPLAKKVYTDRVNAVSNHFI